MATAVALLAVVALAPHAGSASYSSGKKTYTAESTTSCGPVCPYWTGENSDACFKEPLTVPGSWHDRIVTVPIPSGFSKGDDLLLTWKGSPPVDWDLWLCGVDKATSLAYEFIGYSANSPDAPCLDQLGAIGCVEELSISVKAGERLVLRSWNWSDGPVMPAEYEFSA